MSEADRAVKSACELYERDETFRTGIAAWVAERRCDLRLVDVLLEHGLTTQAECARWAATEPDRPYRGGGPKSGPFPSLFDGDYYWYDCGPYKKMKETHDVPRECLGRVVNYTTDRFKSAADALLFLLDNWQGPPSSGTKKRKPRGAVKRRRKK